MPHNDDGPQRKAAATYRALLARGIFVSESEAFLALGKLTDGELADRLTAEVLTGLAPSMPMLLVTEAIRRLVTPK
jgi:hypothetical protein